MVWVAERVAPGTHATGENAMKARSTYCVVLFGLIALPAAGQHADHAREGALLGGVTGALAGAAIGNQNDETTAGALIGGAVGLLTGASLGHSVDREVERRQLQAFHRQQAQAQRLARAVSPADVISMTQSGLSDAVIINHIRQHGVRQPLQVSDVIFLHQQGVSEPVIAALQQAHQAAPPPPPAAARTATPVVVHRHHYLPVVPRYGSYRHYRRPHHGPRSYAPGVHWHIGIGN
jgi:hypothetical protein